MYLLVIFPIKKMEQFSILKNYIIMFSNLKIWNSCMISFSFFLILENRKKKKKQNNESRLLLND